RVPDVLEAIARGNAEEERAQVRARAPGLGEAADDELSTLDELELAPVGVAATGGVGRVEALGDESLPTLPLHARVERARVAGDELAQPERAGAVTGEDPLQARAACHERQRAQILEAVAQDVEGHEGRGLAARALVALPMAHHVDPRLQALKPGRG